MPISCIGSRRVACGGRCCRCVCHAVHGALGAVTVNGNVSAGAGCDLSGTAVNGNVTVNPGGSLTVTSPATITGNLRSKGATTIFVLFASVGGNVQIDGTAGQSFVGFRHGRWEPRDQEQRLAFLEVGAETVGGNVHLHHNSGERLWRGRRRRRSEYGSRQRRGARQLGDRFRL